MNPDVSEDWIVKNANEKQCFRMKGKGSLGSTVIPSASVIGCPLVLNFSARVAANQRRHGSIGSCIIGTEVFSRSGGE